MQTAQRQELEEVLIGLSALGNDLTQSQVQRAIDEHPAHAEHIANWAMQWWQQDKVLIRLDSVAAEKSEGPDAQ